MEIHFIALLLVCLLSFSDAQSGYSEHDIDSELALGTEPLCYSIKDKCKGLGNGHVMKKNCIKCTCHEDGRMVCCRQLQKPVEWDGSCEIKLNRRKCRYELTQIGKPHLKCHKPVEQKKPASKRRIQTRVSRVLMIMNADE